MPLADLIRTLEADTDAELRAIAARRDAEVAHIERAAACARAERISRETAAYGVERRAAAERDLVEATRHARAETIAARGAMLERVRAAVLDLLAGDVANEPRLGVALLGAALSCVRGESGVLRCAPALAAAARAAAPPAIEVAPDPAIATGVRIELATGTAIDATLATLLDRAWPALACEALALVPEHVL